MTPTELETFRRAMLPQGAIALRPKCGGVVVYLYTNARGKPCSVAFYGRATKPKHWYHWRSEADREAHVRRIVAGIQAHQDAKDKRKADRKARGRGLAVGDVLKASWGYEQTNIDWYEVTGLIGATMVELRKIAGESEPTLRDQGKTVPAPGNYIGGPMRRRASDGAVAIDSVCWARKVEPMAMIGSKPVYAAAHFTSYY